MKLQLHYKQYTPSLLTLLGVNAALVYLPKLSPFLGMIYHYKEIVKNEEYTRLLSEMIEVKLPYQKEHTILKLNPENNIGALISNIIGLSAGIFELTALIFTPEDYTKHTVRRWFTHEENREINDDFFDYLNANIKALNIASFSIGLFAFISPTQEYKITDATTGITIDKSILFHPKAKILSLHQSTEIVEEQSDNLFPGDEIQQVSIEDTITNLSS